MGKVKPEKESKVRKEEKESKSKKEKKDKVADDGAKIKKDKKDKKKEKKEKEKLVQAVEQELEKQAHGKSALVEQEAQDDAEETPFELVGAHVPFANPLADAKQTKTILRTVKKSTKAKTLKRGVKEVVKALRKSPMAIPSASAFSDPVGVVVLAADIFPMDVISHLPVLCEDHNIPYVFVRSRAELGSASATKRPTSVVMISKERQKIAQDVDEEEKKDFADSFKKLVSLANTMSANVTV